MRRQKYLRVREKKIGENRRSLRKWKKQTDLNKKGPLNIEVDWRRDRVWGSAEDGLLP